MFDKNRVGTFSIKELGAAMQAIGQNLTSTELQEYTKELDVDGRYKCIN